MYAVSYSYENFTQDAELLFEHWASLRQQESSTEEIIRRFGLLFIDGIDYPEPEVIEALHRIVLSPWAVASNSIGRSKSCGAAFTFNGIINRCFYILINHWWMQPSRLNATAKLVHIAESTPQFPATLVATQKLRKLLQQFRQTEEYEALQDRARIAEANCPPVSDTADHQPLRRLVYRYPFLYPHFLNPWDSSELGFDAIKYQQQQQTRQFEQNLSAYLNHLIRNTAQSIETRKLSGISNPTSLTDQQLKQAVKQFIGSSEGSGTYKQAAQHATRQICLTSSYVDMKQQLHGYITSAFHSSDYPEALKHKFSGWLEERLRETLWNENNENPTGHRLILTCTKLINCLVANPKDPVHSRFHSMFLSLHSNSSSGATFTTGLLLKIALLSQDIRDYTDHILRLMAKRFADLIKHYGNAMSNDENVKWLVECLDNWQVALALHFGEANFSSLANWTNLL